MRREGVGAGVVGWVGGQPLNMKQVPNGHALALTSRASSPRSRTLGKLRGAGAAPARPICSEASECSQGVLHATTTELGHLPMRIRHAQLTWEGAFLNLGALGPGLALHMASGWDPAWTRERTHMRLLVRIPSARHTVHSGDKLLTNLKDSQLVQCSSRVPQLRKYAGRVSRMFGARRSVGLNQSADFKMLTSAVNEERARAVEQQQSILNIKQWNLPLAFQAPSLRCRGPSSPTLQIPGRVGEWRQQHLRGMRINRRWMLMIR